MDLNLLNSLIKIYEQMDYASQAFQQESGLKCLPSCGHCCLNPQVEATPFEMLPLAYNFWQKGLLEEWDGKLEKKEESSPCPLFQQTNPKNPNQGRCGAYSYRPTLCRFFGYMALLNKHGEKRLSICKLIREEDEKRVMSIENDLEILKKAPLLAEWFSKAQSLNSLGTDNERMPIAKALRVAISKIGLSLSFQEQEQEHI